MLEGWAPLRSAKQIFVVVNDRRHTLAEVLAEAQLEDAPAPVAIATLDAGRVYVMSQP